MTAMRQETTSEHIARDMREGRFPERSEPQMVADPAAVTPERIWINEKWEAYLRPTFEGDTSGYIRADLAAVQPAQVLVKPLVWSDRFGPNSECSYDHITADSALGLYRVEWKGWKDFDPPTVCCGGAFIGCYNTIQSAKAAAQADYASRILTALEQQPAQGDYFEGLEEGIKIGRSEPQPISKSADLPDPRDEVIARLVEAADECSKALKDYMKQYPHMVKGYLVDAEQHASAALAAAKAVQHG